jgi:hypothetical protein
MNKNQYYLDNIVLENCKYCGEEFRKKNKREDEH